MQTFVIGATGYVGSAICRALQASGREVFGMSRNTDNRSALAAAGVASVDGTLDDVDHLKQLAAGYDAVVFAPMIPFEMETPVLTALLDACRHSGGHLLYTSGTGVLAIAAPNGIWDENTFAEDDPFPYPPTGSRAMRIGTENLVRDAAADGVRTTVIRPPWIWGNGGGILVWQLVASAQKTGAVCYLGHGLNLYSNVHVDDVARAFDLALDAGRPGALYHTVAGEANIRAVAEAVAEMMGCGTRSIDYATACSIWTREWVDLVLTVNSRSRAVRTRTELGWVPTHLDVIEDIRSGSYRDAYQAARAAGGLAYSWTSHG